MSDNVTKKDNDLIKIMVALFLITWAIIGVCGGILLDAIDENVCDVHKSDNALHSAYYFWDNDDVCVVNGDIISDAPKLTCEILLKTINEEIKNSNDYDIMLYSPMDGIIHKNKNVIEKCVIILEAKGYIVKFNLEDTHPDNGSLKICW